MTYAGFELMTRHTADALVTDDPSGEDRTQTVINPAGGSVAHLSTRRAPELSELGLAFWLGEQPASDLRARIAVVRRVGLEHDGTLAQVDRLDDPLSLDGIDVLQVQQGLRLVNRQLPRFRFRT